MRTGLPRALRDSIRHRFDMAVGGVVENQNLRHDDLLDCLMRDATDLPYGASTITSSEFSIAVILTTATSLMAAPSRASIRTPLTSTEPKAGTRYPCRRSPIAYSTVSPTFRVAPSTRARARIGSASLSLSNPLASVTKRPERSALGNGCDPHAGEPPLELGMIQIWKIRVGCRSRLYSACLIPVPALITWTSPASVRPWLPRLSLCVTAPSRT